MSFLLFIFISIFVFTGVVLAIVVLLHFIETRINPGGNAAIIINGNTDEPVLARRGSNLLSALADNKIFLPSACGGGGTCGLCKCRVTRGAGQLLPTEALFLSKNEIKAGYHLACQMKVRNDIDLVIPPEIFEVKRHECVVVSCRQVGVFIREIVLSLPDVIDFRPGAYIQVDVPPFRFSLRDLPLDDVSRREWEREGLLDLKAQNNDFIFRAYSMANCPAEAGRIILNVRIAVPEKKFKEAPVGKASAYLFSLRPGDKVSVSGPYGEFMIRETKREMIYIGGGAGMAPLRSHIFHLLKTMELRDRKISFWYGARAVRDLFYADEFIELDKAFPNFSFHPALSEPLAGDNWHGHVGLIHQVTYDEYLKFHEDPEEAEYYVCGPPPMVEAVRKMLDNLGVPPDMIMSDSF